ncbi:hypothetical protein F4780DRAFT_540324 [Xylariomycetidae sp. FL0641]|nr:hypothetical protein F4780DRAFT_540324 [Xylariomycetidae sp. FL0641]
MTTIGKISAAVCSVPQEATFALLNGNFDFSLVKIAAPKEYQGLGQALAERKRSEAENGKLHATARRLGSLFHGVLPETPKLIRAYGQRASEIASSPAVNPRGTAEHGPFREYVGIDGGSIWAAATSGSSAIAAHLLACMIACCWRPDEATAIWVEIVSERKKRLEEKVSQADYFDMNEAVSSKLALDQEQLAEWDASARAWLVAADEAPTIRHRQQRVRGLLSKLNTSVNSQQDVYTSVIEAWKTALETLEKVVGGASYSVHEGAVVIGLLAWHIYPDLVIMEHQTRKVIQNDQLVETGGIITIGLGAPEMPGGAWQSGVHWSLSLGYLHYYGPTKTSSQSVSFTPAGKSRFTCDEFLYILLGSVMINSFPFRGWTKDLNPLLNFIKATASVFEQTITTSSRFKSFHDSLANSWIPVIKNLVDTCTRESGEYMKEALRLLRLGMRHPGLISSYGLPYRLPPSTALPPFGLCSFSTLKILNDPKDQDAYLERAIKSFMVPRIGEGANKIRKFLLVLVHAPVYIGGVIFYPNPSILEHSRGKRIYDSKCRKDGGYPLPPGSLVTPASNESRDIPVWINAPKWATSMLLKAGLHKDRYAEGSDYPGYTCVRLGSTSSCTVYSNGAEFHVGVSNGDEIHDGVGLSLNDEDISEHFLDKPLNPQELLRFLERSQFYQMLKSFSAIKEMYAHLPGATICPEVLSAFAAVIPSGHQTPGPPPPEGEFRYPNDAELLESALGHHMCPPGTSFKLILFLESGIDFPSLRYPGGVWERILAVSTTDSLYIHPSITSNPSSFRHGRLELRRVRGNMGRPGVTIITSVPCNLFELQRKAPDPRKWQIVNHNSFDGIWEDLFGATSLHLRITGYTESIQINSQQ